MAPINEQCHSVTSQLIVDKTVYFDAPIHKPDCNVMWHEECKQQDAQPVQIMTTIHQPSLLQGILSQSIAYVAVKFQIGDVILCLLSDEKINLITLIMPPVFRLRSILLSCVKTMSYILPLIKFNFRKGGLLNFIGEKQCYPN